MQLTVTGPTANATLNSATGGGQSPTNYPYVNNGDGTATVTVPDGASGRMWLTWQGYDAVAYEWSDDTADMADAVWQYYIGDPPDHASTLLATINDWLFSLMGDGWQNADTMHAVKALADAIKLKTDNLPSAPAAVGSAMTLAPDQDVRNVVNVTGSVPLDTSSIASAVWSYSSRTLSSFGSLVADVASAVWAAATRTLTSVGSMGADIASAVVSALGPSPNITVIYRAPLTETATLQLIQGDDYFAAAGRDIRLTNYTTLDVHLADDAVSLVLDGTSYVGTATAGEGDKIVLSWELTAEQTKLIPAGLHTADIVADGESWGHRVIGRIEVSVAER